ncbi:MAG: hypothetical protein JXJ17_09160 [Anaerolineae bacterium]|nr:hypothetical protein [Anaerolineae bacterium]
MQAVSQTQSQAADIGQEAAPFKRGVLGWIAAGLNALAAINASFVFLVQMKSGVLGWLMMNTCTPSIALYLAGFLIGSPAIMTAGSVLMFRYGTLGLFVFSWDGYNIFAQVGHLLMTAAVILTAVDIVKNRRWRQLWIGLAVGAVLVVIFAIAQNAYFAAHPGLLEALFSGTY